jgi:hypothetical protein
MTNPRNLALLICDALREATVETQTDDAPTLTGDLTETHIDGTFDLIRAIEVLESRLHLLPKVGEPEVVEQFVIQVADGRLWEGAPGESSDGPFTADLGATLVYDNIHDARSRFADFGGQAADMGMLSEFHERAGILRRKIICVPTALEPIRDER